MKAEKRVLVLMFAVSAMALLFPPWGYGGASYEQFAFIFSTDVPVVIKGEYVTYLGPSSVAWKTLGAEMAIIYSIGLSSYFLVKK